MMSLMVGGNEAKMDFISFLEKYGLYICLGVVFLILLTILIIFIIRPKTKKETKPNIDIDEFITSLGGKENIISFQQVGSRINLELNDMEKVDSDNIKKYGVNNVIKMSSRLVLVCEDASKLAKLLEN